MKGKLPKRNEKAPDGKRSKQVPFENVSQLETIVDFNLRGHRTGAFLLKHPSKSNNGVRLVFAFDCKGIHTHPRENQIEDIFKRLEAGGKDLPYGENLTIHLRSVADDRDRQQELGREIQSTETLSSAIADPLQFLLIGEAARTHELTQQGLRKPKTLRLYCTYTLQNTGEESRDWLEKALRKTNDWYLNFIGNTKETQHLRLKELLTKGFTDGFLLWLQKLTTKMGLEVRPLSAEELWLDLWYRFNQKAPPAIPQKLILNDRGLKEITNSDAHILSHLTEEGLPKTDPRWVHVNNRYAGVLTFLEKPGGWNDDMAQLRYLWDSLLSRETIVDTEIIAQISLANEQQVKLASQRLLRQSNNAALAAGKQNTIDVVAQLKTQKTAQVQQSLYEGAVPNHVEVAIVVYRDNLNDLAEACRHIEHSFLRPARVVREVDVAWKFWLQTLPIQWSNLLSVFLRPRTCYLSNEAPGLLPLVLPAVGDKRGVELVSDEGGCPIFIDLFTQHKSLALFGMTRSGKSVLVGGILTHALAASIPIVAVDFPKNDGSSTFDDYTRFVGGAYYDVSRESCNLFEFPDLNLEALFIQEFDEIRNESSSEYTDIDRFIDYRAFLESALMTMVMGRFTENLLLAQTVRSILSLSLKGFFRDPDIQRRYCDAQRDGFGSAAWFEMPTLKDFYDFCMNNRADVGGTNAGKTQDAFDHIKLRLRSWLDSRIGRCIGRPSTFRTDAPLIVFALRNLNNDEDAAIMSILAYAAGYRRSMSSPVSLFFIDEAPILFSFPEIADLVGRVAANGGKSGIRLILSGQDPNTIYNSGAGSRIFHNISTRLVGRIQPSAVESFQEILKYPEEIISRNASDDFFPRRSGIYSQWLLDDNGKFTYCRFYVPLPLLAVCANNQDEQIVRRWFLRHYPDQFEAIAHFSRFLVEAIQQDEPLLSQAMLSKLDWLDPVDLEQFQHLLKQPERPNMSVIPKSRFSTSAKAFSS